MNTPCRKASLPTRTGLYTGRAPTQHARSMGPGARGVHCVLGSSMLLRDLIGATFSPSGAPFTCRPPSGSGPPRTPQVVAPLAPLRPRVAILSMLSDTVMNFTTDPEGACIEGCAPPPSSTCPCIEGCAPPPSSTCPASLRSFARPPSARPHSTWPLETSISSVC